MSTELQEAFNNYRLQRTWWKRKKPTTRIFKSMPNSNRQFRAKSEWTNLSGFGREYGRGIPKNIVLTKRTNRIEVKETQDG